MKTNTQQKTGQRTWMFSVPEWFALLAFAMLHATRGPRRVREF